MSDPRVPKADESLHAVGVSLHCSRCGQPLWPCEITLIAEEDRPDVFRAMEARSRRLAQASHDLSGKCRA